MLFGPQGRDQPEGDEDDRYEQAVHGTDSEVSHDMSAAVLPRMVEQVKERMQGLPGEQQYETGCHDEDLGFLKGGKKDLHLICAASGVTLLLGIIAVYGRSFQLLERSDHTRISDR